MIGNYYYKYKHIKDNKAFCEKHGSEEQYLI